LRHGRKKGIDKTTETVTGDHLSEDAVSDSAAFAETGVREVALPEVQWDAGNESSFLECEPGEGCFLDGCAENADCKAVGGADDVCVDYGEGGRFCGGACAVEVGAGKKCPWGFSCQEPFLMGVPETTR